MNRATNDDAPLPSDAADPATRHARHILAMRRSRREHLPDILFGEPGWELMLHLYVAEAERRRLSAQDCLALVSLPATTAARWIKLLTAEGLAVEDPKTQTLTLTAAARAQLEAFLRQFAATPSPVWRQSAAR